MALPGRGEGFSDRLGIPGTGQTGPTVVHAQVRSTGKQAVSFHNARIYQLTIFWITLLGLMALAEANT